MSAPEEWRPIEGRDGYEISSLGRVRSVDRVICQVSRSGHPYERRMRGRIQTPWPTGTIGYLTVNLGQGIRRYVHQLVCEAWHGPRPDGEQARHFDGDHLNNTPENVLWGTDSQNKQDMIRHGRNYLRSRTRCGRRHLLVPPNLDEWHLPGRHCLACRRARTIVRRARLRGITLDLQVESDRRYAEIMGEVADCA